MADLQEILKDAGSAFLDVRRQAEERLLSACALDFAEYCKALARELCNEDSPSMEIRQRAGLILKNAISSNDSKADAILRDKWVNGMIQTADKDIVKTMILELIGAPHTRSEEARRTACQVASKIARLEIPQNTWPQFFSAINAILLGEATGGSKVAVQLLLGYFTEDIHQLGEGWGRELISDDTKTFILSSLTRGMTDQDLEVKLAALKGFYHGVLFAKRFLALDSDRLQLFRIVGGGIDQQLTMTAVSPSSTLTPAQLVIAVQKAAWEVLYQMVAECYQYLGEIIPDILRLSFDRLSKASCIEREELALSAIEFWASVCDEDLIQGTDSKNYIAGVKNSLLPLLFEATTVRRPDELDDEDIVSFSDDEWRPNYAAASCINLCAQVIHDDILTLALNFIHSRFGSPEWPNREGAILVYSSILEGVTSSAAVTMLDGSIPSLCKALDDPALPVRDVCAWTFGIIARFHMCMLKDFLPNTMPTANTEKPQSLIDLLLRKTSDAPKVVRNICFALYEIFVRAKAQSEYNLKDKFEILAEHLIAIAKREDSGEADLRSKAFDVLYILVAETGDTCDPRMLVTLLANYVDWCANTLNLLYTEEIGHLQGSMVGGINAVVEKLGQRAPDVLLSKYDEIVTLLLRILKHGAIYDQNSIKRWSPATEDVFLAYSKLLMSRAGALASAGLTLNVANETPNVEFVDILAHTIISRDNDIDICGVGLEFIGTLATYTPATLDVNRFADLLFQVLRDPNQELMKVKPKAIMSLADIALNCPKNFQPFLRAYFEFLSKASATTLSNGPAEDQYWIDYLTDLRDACMCGYSASICCIRETSVIPQGTSASGFVGVNATSTPSTSPNITSKQPLPMLEQEVSKILDLSQLVLTCTVATDSNLQNALRLIQDLISSYKRDVIGHIKNTPLFLSITQLHDRNDNPEIKKELAQLEELINRYGA